MTKKTTSAPNEASIAAQAAGNFALALCARAEKTEAEGEEQRQVMLSGAVAHSQHLQAHPELARGTFVFKDGSSVTRL